MITLPPLLACKIEHFLKENLAPKGSGGNSVCLEKSYKTLSYRYHEQALRYGFKDKNEGIAYAAARFPATYGAACTVLSAIPKAIHLQSFLDLGAGPGTATLAALSLFNSLKDVTLIEQDLFMHRLSQHLLSGEIGPEKQVSFSNKNLLRLSSFPPHDAVMLSYVLTELSAADQLNVLQKAWSATKKIIVIISPGTPVFFTQLLKIRQWLINQNARLLAPCPGFLGHFECPLEKERMIEGGQDADWCHFSARIFRTTAHKHAKNGQLSYEDEKFSYLIAERTTVEQEEHEKYKDNQLTARLIRPPLLRKGHVVLDACTPQGLKRHIISKRRKNLYKEAQDLKWGDSFSPSALSEETKD